MNGRQQWINCSRMKPSKTEPQLCDFKQATHLPVRCRTNFQFHPSINFHNAVDLCDKPEAREKSDGAWKDKIDNSVSVYCPSDPLWVVIPLKDCFMSRTYPSTGKTQTPWWRCIRSRAELIRIQRFPTWTRSSECSRGRSKPPWSRLSCRIATTSGNPVHRRGQKFVKQSYAPRQKRWLKKSSHD